MDTAPFLGTAARTSTWASTAGHYSPASRVLSKRAALRRAPCPPFAPLSSTCVPFPMPSSELGRVVVGWCSRRWALVGESARWRRSLNRSAHAGGDARPARAAAWRAASVLPVRRPGFLRRRATGPAEEPDAPLGAPRVALLTIEPLRLRLLRLLMLLRRRVALESRGRRRRRRKEREKKCRVTQARPRRRRRPRARAGVPRCRPSLPRRHVPPRVPRCPAPHPTHARPPPLTPAASPLPASAASPL